MARPLKLEDGRLRNALLRRIRRGERLDDLCHAEDIDYSTFRRWLRDGEPPENPDEDPLEQPRPTGRTAARVRARREYDVLALKRQFYHEVRQAEAAYRTKLDGRLRTLANDNFQHLLTYARLRNPDRYREQAPSQVVQVNQAGHDGGPVTFARIAADALADEQEGADDGE